MSHLRSIWVRLVFAGLLAPLLACSGGSSPGPERVTGGEWPQFRGPGGRGISEESDLPSRWRPAGKNFRWKTPIPGAGDSSPVVSGGRVFLTTAFAEPQDTREEVVLRPILKRVVLAFDLESGEPIWETKMLEGPKGKIHWLNSFATPTPVTDGKTLFVSFDAYVAALDVEDGRILWLEDLEPSYYEHSHYGAASSPVLGKKAVIVLQDREEGATEDRGWVVALDRETGKELWRHEWIDTCCSYTTPVLIERDSREIVIVTTSYQAHGFDAATGERLWEVKHENLQPVPSVAVWEDLVAFPGAIHDALLSTFRLGGPTDEPEFLWATRQAVPDIPSPVYYMGRLYTIKKGALSSRNPMTGQSFWRQRLAQGEYRAALIAGDGKLYAMRGDGGTSVIDATRKEFKLIRENRLGEASRATPAIADGCLIIRGEDHLFCIEKRGEEADAA